MKNHTQPVTSIPDLMNKLLDGKDFDELSPFAIKVYCALVRQLKIQNMREPVCLSYARLAAIVGTGSNQISMALKQMCNRKYIYKVKRNRSVNSYYFTLPQDIVHQNGYIYIIRQPDFYKIGQTLYPSRRLKAYHTNNPNNVKYCLLAKVADMDKVETILLTKFEAQVHRGEWFNLTSNDLMSAYKIVVANGGEIIIFSLRDQILMLECR